MDATFQILGKVHDISLELKILVRYHAIVSDTFVTMGGGARVPLGP